ncbi:glutathione S-transferase family protein [Dongia mobilis]|uniref:glutathione S-transferase family protein n=1 Tax=Dongia sp. TaxID=1977262 RepID=UPI0026EE36BD
MLKLFYSPQSCALASHLALAEAGAAFEAVRVDFARQEQRQPDYLRINPKGRVPALVTDRGILTETPAILFYVAQTHPAAGLAPLDDPFELGRIQAFNSYLCSTVHVAHAHRMRGYRWADDPATFADMARKVPGNVRDCFALIEAEMFKGPWVMGGTFSICDPYLYTLATWLEDDGVDPGQFPRILDHRNRMSQRPNVARVLALHQ